ncbi:unnamed protein product [Arabis nemorensis]|uniref:Senescence regulator S40 n=1 Tax=Arabis nemorensis TaxID=586526 RepID=A0A565CH23_9BRAS|nr:unnamed protein product [Arabis nemorensis]
MASRKLFSVKPKYIYPVPEPEIMSENDDNVFEFDESDIHHIGDQQSPNSFDTKRSRSISRLRRKPTKTGDSGNRKTPQTGSLPVNIPDWSKILKTRRRGSSFTVHEGIGGTAKGRDLRRLRNAIWEKIGFQD